jgi:serine phosphatase RsbU (regulator of sigma subunit)
VAILKVLKGDDGGRVIHLHGERTVIGRHPHCQIVFDNVSVSRHHAQILESHGTFYLEDLRSRNGTYLNGELLEGRTQLSDGDQIRVCDIVADFQLRNESSEPEPPEEFVLAQENESDAPIEGLIASDPPAASPGDVHVSAHYAPRETGRVDGFDELEFGDDASSIVSQAGGRLPSDSFRSGLDPDVKLKAVLEISQSLRRELEVDAVLPKILAALFRIFPHADQGFILLKDAQTQKLRVKATRSRGGGKSDEVAVSMTVVRQVLDSRAATRSRDVLSDPRFRTSTSLVQFQIHSMMCVPLIDVSGDAVGVIQINTLRRDFSFEDSDLDLLVSVAAQAELALENARLHEALVHQRDLERDLEFATQVQLGFLPKDRPKVPGYMFADYYEAALRVGGDYFDYISLPDGRLAIALGDVAGKGMPAALLMARLYSSARFQLFTAQTPADAMKGLNIDVAGSGLGHRFITLVLMVLHPSSGAMTIVNAGHLPPLLRRANGDVDSVARKESGLPLGIVPDQSYQSVSLTLQPGESLLAFTDGITESMNRTGEIYARDRLQSCVSQTTGGIVSQIKALICDVETFGGGLHSRDDTCCVGLERLPLQNLSRAH